MSQLLHWPVAILLLVLPPLSLIVIVALVLKLGPALISRPDWAVLAVIVASLASLMAYIQVQDARMDRRDREVRSFATVDALIGQGLRLTASDARVRCAGRPVSEGLVSRVLAVSRLERMRQVSAALQGVNMADLPSHAAVALTHARAGMSTLQHAVEAASSASECVSTNVAGYELVAAARLLNEERARRYCLTRVGAFSFGDAGNEH